MFDNITTEERQNSRRTEPTFLKARKSKFFHQQAQSESEDSNGSHTNETDIIEAKPSGGPGSNGYFLLWLCPLLFIGCILLTNLVLGL